MADPLLFVSAGDPSGDNACARLINVLREDKPDLQMFGLGGSRLGELGQEQLAEPSDLAVLGFWEVARRFLFFRRLLKQCAREIEKRRPKAILLVDYPGFNLRLARRIRKLGIPIIYYISPQVWAWGRGRLRQIRDNIDQMLVILPFEEAFYKKNGVPCRFVGHYLLEDIPAEFISSSPPGSRQVAILPGSRRQEIERMLPSMLEAAALLHRRNGLTSRVAAIRGVFDYESACSPYFQKGVDISYDNSRQVVNESDLVLTASGTATLETGIIGRPMVVVYKTGFLTYQIARRLVTLDSIALVNLVLGKKVVPELIQAEATPQNMADAISHYLEDENHYQQILTALQRLPVMLGGQAASRQSAKAILEYL